jgi:hypothetical protein
MLICIQSVDSVLADQMAKLLNELGEDYRIVADIDRVKWVLGIRIGKNAQRFD